MQEDMTSDRAQGASEVGNGPQHPLTYLCDLPNGRIAIGDAGGCISSAIRSWAGTCTETAYRATTRRVVFPAFPDAAAVFDLACEHDFPALYDMPEEDHVDLRRWTVDGFTIYAGYAKRVKHWVIREGGA